MKTEINNKISLKAARVNAKMTMIEAAKELGIAVSTLVNWEKEPWKISALYQEKISDTYKISIDSIDFFCSSTRI